jgi:mRNA interferase RelE/StbE
MKASYELRFAKSFQRDLRSLAPNMIPVIVEKAMQLERNPRPAQSKKLRGSEAYRLRIGDYRVFYTIDDGRRSVTVYHVAHRREAYR